MKQLFSIRSRELTYRIIIISVLLFSGIIIFGALKYSNESVQESKKNIYIMTSNNSVVKAQSTDIRNRYDILAKGFIAELHADLFKLVPYPKEINRQMDKAKLKGDQSIAKWIDVYKQRKFYQSIVDQNYFTIVNYDPDSLKIDYSMKPYKFQFKGNMGIIRNGKVHYRNLITQGYIEYMNDPSESNDESFYIRNFNIIDDTDLKQ